jgi:aspartyl/glutamyl-tRNA(Asn/Gln) amidotransferase C subunit
MALTHDEVRKIATLARLRFEPEEEARFAAHLGRIVDYIDQLQRFEGVGAAAASGSGLPPPAPEAEDRPQPTLPRPLFLANAPQAFGPFLVVPKVKASGGDA